MLLHTHTQVKHRGHLCRHDRMSGPAADVTNVLLLLRMLRSGWPQIAFSVRLAWYRHAVSWTWPGVRAIGIPNQPRGTAVRK